MRRLLLFDVDGTLVHTGGAGRTAIREALLEVYGCTGPVESYDFHGRTDPEIVRGLLRAAGRTDGEVDRGLPRFWELYLAGLERALTDGRRAVATCPGVVPLLEALRADGGFALGLVTGNVREGAWRKLEACGIREPFAFGAFGSDSERRDELPPLAIRRAARHTGRRFRPGETWIIGDTPRDVHCGRRSGTRTLAVATGRHDAGTLRAAGADRVVEDLRDAAGLLRELAA